MSSLTSRSIYRRKSRVSIFAGFDPILTGAVAALLVIGTLLVYAATRDWYASNNLDPQYYLKRHVINILIGVLMAWGTTIIDYRLLRAYTPILWGLGVLGLIVVLIFVLQYLIKFGRDVSILAYQSPPPLYFNKPI